MPSIISRDPFTHLFVALGTVEPFLSVDDIVKKIPFFSLFFPGTKAISFRRREEKRLKTISLEKQQEEGGKREERDTRGPEIGFEE